MKIRILIVDDSPFVRDILKEVLSATDDIEIVGEARDGQEALDKLSSLKPDVITMDLLMPMVGGLEAAEHIMHSHPTAILLLADTDSLESLEHRAQKVGAVGAFAKPRNGFGDEQGKALADAIRRAASFHPKLATDTPPLNSMRGLNLRDMKVLGIVSSTGGPQTVARFLGKLPADLPIPICLVQHTSAGFSGKLVSWLGEQCQMEVELAHKRSILRPGVVTIAPDDQHLEIRSGGIVRINDGPAIQSLRPSGDMLLRSLAKAYGKSSAALVCTGMGQDGSEGLHEIHSAGGICLVQDPSTAILSSMPASAHKRVPSSWRVDLERLATRMTRDLK